MPATYEKIATTTLGSTATSFSFSSIPATYTDLRLVMVSILQTSLCIPGIRFNGLTTNIMSQVDLYGDGTTAGASSNTSTSRVLFGVAAQTTSDPAFFACDIFSYAGSTNKTLLVDGYVDRNGSGYVSRSVGLWRNTSAITSLTILEVFGNGFAVGTTATLYGIKAA
tara:strand:- start:1673 stop:2173 length:501 start_codon:yes stop_codon:yes gene_type:complete